MHLLHDLRLAARTLLRAPAFTFASILTLAIGVAGVATVFAVFHAVLLRPLPVSAPAELVTIDLRREDGSTIPMMSYPQYELLREAPRGLSGLTAFSLEEYAVAWPDGEPSLSPAYEASANYFDVLGVRPAAGRFFREGVDDVAGGNPVVVISHQLWQTRFAGSPDALGSTLRVNGQPLTIIGVAPAGFDGTIAVMPADFWVPLTMVPVLRQVPGMYRPGHMQWLMLVGRLAPGTSRAAARELLSEQVRGIVARDAARFDPRDGVRSNRAPVAAAHLAPLRGLPEMVVLPAAGFLGFLFAAALLVLVIGGVNITSLMLARITARGREMAVRRSLGASRWRLAAQLAVEHSLLFAAGTAAGVLLTAWALSGLPLLFADLPGGLHLPLSVNPSVLGFAALLALLMSLTFGLPPALHGARSGDAGLAGEMRQERRGTRLRSGLVIAQVALSMLLLVSAGLLTRALQRALNVDTGFDATSVVAAELSLAPHGYDLEQSRVLVDQLVQRLADRSDVLHAGRSSMQPLLGYSTVVMRPDGQVEAPQQGVDANYVDGGFFRTLQVPIVAGRPFDDADARSGGVAVVNEAFAARYWPGEDPLGRTIYLGSAGDDQPVRVTGVARDGRYRSLADEARPFVYLPWTGARTVNVYVRGDVAAGALIAAMRAELRALDPSIPLREPAPLQRRIGILLLPQRIGAAAVGSFGALGLLLAAIGIYGLVAFTVAQRTREIGIRMALGAQSGNVVRLFLRQGARLLVAGSVVGLVLAFGAAHALAALLYGLGPADPVTFTAVPLLLTTVALLAAYVPARRASRTDPAVVLRSD
jgi:putative ABC transport system permease protein